MGKAVRQLTMFVAISASAIGAPAAAHDFWLEPADFAVSPGDLFAVRALIGKAGEDELWGVARTQVAGFESVGAAGAADQSARLGAAVSLLTLKLDDPGAHWLTLSTHHASSELPAWSFNAYIVEEGLAPAVDRRQERREETLPGREIYHRCVKSLVRAGEADGDAALIVTPLGHRLEIVPEADPYALNEGAPLPVRVEYEGHPLAGATVRIGGLDRGEPAGTALTDAAGRAELAIPHDGAWVLAVAWTAPLDGDPRADFDTTFASLSFAFQEAED